MNGAELIAAERKRQTDAEGWTPEHDDGHAMAELASAAVVYIEPWTLGARWPWRPSEFKPGERIRDLTKAGALLAAEIDRLQRAAS